MNYEMQRYKKNSKIKKATFPAAFYVFYCFYLIKSYSVRQS